MAPRGNTRTFAGESHPQRIKPVQDPAELRRIQEWAEEEFPEESPEVALRRHIVKNNVQDVFYVGDDGMQTIRGEGKFISILVLKIFCSNDVVQILITSPS